MDIAGNRTVRDLLMERTARHPARAALVHEAKDGSLQTFSYSQLTRSVQRAAAGFQGAGVKHGDRVVVHLPNVPEFVFAWLGLAWIGAVAVPTNTGNRAAEMRHVVDLSGARVVLSTREHLDWLCNDESGLSSVQTWIDVGTATEAQRPMFREWLETDRIPVPAAVRSSDLAELIFTSGTSTLPKAVMLTHANYLNAGEREMRVTMVGPDDRLLTCLPLFHVNAQANTILAALTAGATAILLEEYSASRFWDQVRRHRATVLSLVAMQARTLLAQPERETDPDHEVRRLLYAINIASVEKDAFESRFNVELINGYGLSEAMCVVTAAPVFGDKRWPSIGVAATGRELRIVAADGSPVGVGEPGALEVKGVPGRTIMLGYYNDPVETEKALRGGWLCTGDNATFDELGYIYFLDRAKDVIKRAGENISSSEVEAVITSHPSVAEAAVIGVPDAVRDEAVMAFVVLEPGTELLRDDLIEFVGARLAKFKVPTMVEFCEALPKTSVGKIEKRILRKRVVHE